MVDPCWSYTDSVQDIQRELHQALSRSNIESCIKLLQELEYRVNVLTQQCMLGYKAGQVKSYQRSISESLLQPHTMHSSRTHPLPQKRLEDHVGHRLK
jgi:hypothetical protein